VPATKQSPEPISATPRGLIAGLLTPSLGDFFFLAMLVLLFFTSQGWLALLADGDTGWHIRTGQWILQNHQVPHADLFSFSNPGAPWYSWEWLSDVIFAAAYAQQGLKGVVAVSGLLIGISILIVFRYLLWRGAGIALAVLLCVLVADASQNHYLARPHVFTLVLLPICLFILDRDRERPSAAVWILVPIAALWTNLHGGFVALFVSLGIYATGAFIRGRWKAVRRPLLLTVACALVTLANPYGYRLHLHIAQYLRSSWIAQHVDEFRAPAIRSEGMHKYEVLLFAGIAVLVVLVRKRRYEDAMLVAFWAHESLQASRHVSIYMLAAAPILGTEAALLAERYTAGMPRSSLVGTLRDLVGDFSWTARRSSIWVAIIAITVWFLPAGPQWPTDFPATFPVAMVGRNRAMLAPAGGTPPRLLSLDQWGGYLIYKLYPGMPVFIDGRSDFYGQTIGEEYSCLLRGCDKWESIMEKWRFDAVLWPKGGALTEFLKTRPDWRVVDEDARAILMRKQPAVP